MPIDVASTPKFPTPGVSAKHRAFVRCPRETHDPTTTEAEATMTPAALHLAQVHDAPPAHLLVVGVLAVAGAAGWLLVRATRRRGDERSPTTSGRVPRRVDQPGAAPRGDDRA
jgi:hypothetical protein